MPDQDWGVEQAYVRYVTEIDLSGSQITELMREVLELGRPFRFKARGTSMFPFIRDGDVVSITPLAGRAPSLGTVASFSRPNTATGKRTQLVVHRLIERKQGACYFLGDNQPQSEIEGPVDMGSVLGVVSRVERSGKAIYLGRGPERYPIALVSRWGLLGPIVSIAATLRRLSLKYSPSWRNRR